MSYCHFLKTSKFVGVSWLHSNPPALFLTTFQLLNSDHSENLLFAHWVLHFYVSANFQDFLPLPKPLSTFFSFLFNSYLSLYTLYNSHLLTWIPNDSILNTNWVLSTQGTLHIGLVAEFINGWAYKPVFFHCRSSSYSSCLSITLKPSATLTLKDVTT